MTSKRRKRHINKERERERTTRKRKKHKTLPSRETSPQDEEIAEERGKGAERLISLSQKFNIAGHLST